MIFCILTDIVIIINGFTVVFEVVMASDKIPSERDFSTVPWFSHIFTASKNCLVSVIIMNLKFD